MNFHQKLGAELVEVLPGGRSEDTSALGYTMLLRYAVPTEKITLDPHEPVSSQLIHAVLLLAQDLNLSEMFALSRPGGLASYLAD